MSALSCTDPFCVKRPESEEYFCVLVCQQPSIVVVATCHVAVCYGETGVRMFVEAEEVLSPSLRNYIYAMLQNVNKNRREETQSMHRDMNPVSSVCGLLHVLHLNSHSISERFQSELYY